MKPKERIGSGKEFLMKVVAIGFDTIAILGLIPFIGWVFSMLVAIFGSLTFFMWFMMSGVRFIKSKNIGVVATSAIIEIIPILNILPGFSLSVWRVIKNTKEEDKERNKKNLKKTTKIRNEEALVKQKYYNKIYASKALEERELQKKEQELLENQMNENALYDNMVDVVEDNYDEDNQKVA
jgi:uncharacterized membrane protein